MLLLSCFALSWLKKREEEDKNSLCSPPLFSKKKKKTLRQTKACSNATEPEIASLFTKWNDKLKTQDPDQIVPLYAEKSVLLPTLSNTPR